MLNVYSAGAGVNNNANNDLTTSPDPKLDVNHKPNPNSTHRGCTDTLYTDREVSGLFVALAEPVLITHVMHFAEEHTTVQGNGNFNDRVKNS